MENKKVETSPLKIKIEVPNEIKYKEPPKKEIEYPLLQKLCRYLYVENHDLLLICTCSEISLYNIKNLQVLTTKKIPEIFSQKTVRVIQIRDSLSFLVVYDCFEILKILIEKNENFEKKENLTKNENFEKNEKNFSIKIIQHIWCYDEEMSPNESRFTYFNNITLFNNQEYFLESLTSSIPTITKIDSKFEKSNNVYKGNLKKIFEFNFILEDEENNILFCDDNFIVSFSCGIISVIDFSPRLKKIKRKVEICFDEEFENFEKISKNNYGNFFFKKKFS